MSNRPPSDVPASTHADESPARPVTSAGVPRRGFLKGAAIVASGVAFGSAMPTIALADRNAIADAEWQRLAAFITGKSDLPADLTARAYVALRATEPGFDTRLAALTRRIDAAALKDVDAFRESALAADPTLLATAVAIISAFYLGRVGKPPDAQFVSYEAALMYRPTADVMVTPTFSHAAPGYWAEPPKT